MFLGLNLAVEPISIGLISSEKIIGNLSLCAGHSFSENLILEIDRFCAKNQVDIAQLQGIGIVNGPGSYTGLRVAVTFGKTFCQIKGLPLYAFSTLQVLVFQYRFFDGVYLAVLPACQGEVNAALFGVKDGQLNRLTDDFSCKTATLLENIAKINGKIFVIGRITEEIQQVLLPHKNLVLINNCVLNGSTIAELALREYQEKTDGNYEKIYPHYSHQPNLKKLDQHKKK
jgi:tRNA threonylcarbamoyladenosine biosynthesis protein TsaB